MELYPGKAMREAHKLFLQESSDRYNSKQVQEEDEPYNYNYSYSDTITTPELSDSIVLEAEPPAYVKEVEDIIDEWDKAMESLGSEESGITLPDSIKQPEEDYNDDPYDDTETV